MMGSGNWCGTSVEIGWTGVGSSVEFRCLWLVVEVGGAMERRGRFVRGVSGN